MKVAALNQVDAQAVADQHEDALAAAYLRVLQSAGRKAAQRFRAMAPLAMVAANEPVSGNPPNWTPPDIDELVDLSLIAEQTSRQTASLHVKTLAQVLDAYGRVIRQVTVPVVGRPSFDVTNPLALTLLSDIGGRSGDVAKSIRDDLQKIIGDAYTRGLSVLDAAAIIQERTDEFSQAQARMLAKVDLNGIANGGSLIAARAVGVQFKTWLCVTGETAVQGYPLRVSRRNHAGELVVLRVRTTSRPGDSIPPHRDLSVTPNHAIFTGRGWVEAKFIQPGDRVFGCTPFDVPTIVEPDVENTPPTIAELFVAASETRPAERMVGRVVNLDCQWEECEVDVVTLDRQLRDWIAPHISEPGCEHLFTLTDVGLNEALTLSGSLGVRGGKTDSHTSQGALVSGSKGVVVINHPPQTASLGLAADRDASKCQMAFNSFLGGTQPPGDCAEGLAALVTGLDVVAVEVIPWSGHVYDLETETGWFLANGIIVHNSASDDLVRPTHQEANGQTVPVDQPFDVGGESADYPCDPQLSDAEACGCRCTLVYEETLDGEESETASGLPSTATGATIGGDMKPAQITIPLTFSIGTASTATVEDAIRARSESRVSGGLELGESFVRVNTDPEPEQRAPAAGRRWRAVLCVEGEPTEDGRLLETGSISWRELPLTLLAQTETQPGHDGAEVCGRVDRIWREGTRIMGEGVFDSGEFGTEIARLVSDQTLRGLSVDLAVLDFERRPMPGAPDPAEDEMPAEMFVVLEGVIGAATVCSFQAIAEATIEVLTSAAGFKLIRVTQPFAPERFADDPETVVASAAPLYPPADWFENPGLDRPTMLTVTDDGRVFGHVAPWKGCHAGYLGRCVPPPRSRSGYSHFHVGRVKTDDGELVAVGRLTLAAGHADTQGLTLEQARAHYDNTATVAAFVRAGEDEHGIWVAGVLRHDVPPAMVQDLLANPLSGDWRNGEMVAAHAVPLPGFPILQASAIGPDGGEETALIITSTIGQDLAEPDLALRSRVLAARARGGIDGLAALAHA